MHIIIVSSTFLLTLMSAAFAFAQNFNHTQGYIFDQAYVTRIKEDTASEKLKIPNVGNWLLEQHAVHGVQEVLGNGVSRSGKTLIFKAAGKPSLRLQTYVYRGKNDSGDSQRFVYIRPLGSYHVVCVEFDHDAPGFLLIDEESLKIYFVDH